MDLAFATPGIHELCVTAFNVCDTIAPSCMTVEVFGPETTDLVVEVCSDDCFEVADTLLCESGVYSFLLNTIHGCDSTVNVDLTVLETVHVDLGGAICSTDSIFVGDTWYFPPGQFIEVTTAYNGCDSIINLTLDAIICEIVGEVEGQPVLCHGDTNGTLTFSVLDGTPPFTYTWVRLDGNPSGAGNLPGLSSAETISGLPPGIFLITVNDTYGNDVVLIGVVGEPFVLSVDLFAASYNGYEVSCNGSSDGTLTALPQGGTPGYAFQWNNGSSQSFVSGLPAGDYLLTVTDAAGCTATAMLALQEPPPLFISGLFVDPGCDGFDTGSITLADAGGGVPPYQYGLFNDFGLDTLFTGLGSGTYILSILDANDCTASATGTLTAALIPTLDAGEDFTLELGDSRQIPVFIDLAPQTILWSPAYGLSCTDCLTPVAGPYETTSYTLTVTSADGCPASDSLTVYVVKPRDIYVPNIFSPNFDGINDGLTVFAGKSVRQIRRFQVFSRWGELVFERSDFAPNDAGLGWDGRFKGKKMQEGVYAWLAEVEYLDGETRKILGDVTLIQ
ncbi:MAG: gliding motility-associated C-terminal domain-containing protein [Lewinellaceae bacterium]|nr:gliding motility-associated C-terminal domain-containing protein [Lewinellaceae bacterium]